MTLRDQLMRDEGGIRLSAYQDSRGLWTIGVGHCIQTRPISRRAAEVIFEDDLIDTLNDVHRALPWAAALGDARFAVLANMAYQMGMGGLLSFRRMLAAVERRDFAQAAAEMRHSEWARQTPNRCERLATQMERGEWV